MVCVWTRRQIGIHILSLDDDAEFVVCRVKHVVDLVVCILVVVGGKQWQPTPKNVPRMQCARAIPVA
jgi:hypothetical protein